MLQKYSWQQYLKNTHGNNDSENVWQQCVKVFDKMVQNAHVENYAEYYTNDVLT